MSLILYLIGRLLWFRILFAIKNTAFLGTQKNEGLWNLSAFLSLFLFDSASGLSFLCFATASVVVLYSTLTVFSWSSESVATVLENP